MTDEEKDEILQELEKRLEDKYKGYLSKEDVAVVLKRPRNIR